MRNFEETEKVSKESENDMVYKAKQNSVICYGCKQPGHKANECPSSKKWCPKCKSKSHDLSECKRKWCDKCKNKTYNTDDCRKIKSQNKSSVKSASDDSSKPENYFAFKVSESLTPDVPSLNGLLSDCGATAHIIHDTKPPSLNLTEEERLAIKSLRENEDIVI